MQTSNRSASLHLAMVLPCLALYCIQLIAGHLDLARAHGDLGAVRASKVSVRMVRSPPFRRSTMVGNKQKQKILLNINIDDDKDLDDDDPALFIDQI